MNEPILKIGMTKQINHERFKQYPKGSILLFQMICSDCNYNEKQIIELFKNKYIHRKDIGNEYFEGDYTQMMDDIYLIVTYNEKQNKKMHNNIVYEIADDIFDEVINELINDEINDEILDEINDEILDEINDEILDEINDEEDFEKIEISTYKDYKKYCPINFNIIITNKLTQEGYIKFPSQLWYKLYDKNMIGFDENYMETLERYITKELIFTDTNIEYNFHFNNLLQNIVTKCYVKNPKYYELQYNEFIVSYSNKKYILDALSYTFINIDTITNQIIIDTKSILRPINIDTTIDTFIVDDILNSLIIYPEKIIEFKKLCYTIFVKSSDSINIFYDYCSQEEYLLSGWLCDLLYTLLGDKYILHSYNHYENIDESIQLIKLIKPRCVFITMHKHFSIDKMIDEFIILGITNIIIKNNDNTQNIYNIDKYKKEYLHKESQFVKIFCKDNSRNIIYNNDIFNRTSLLFDYFLKWCMTI